MFRTQNGKELYRIGDCIISVNAQNPSVNFGGEWELLCPGRTIVCVDTKDGDFNSLKKTGGSKYLQSHNHGASTNSAGWHGHSGSAGGGDHRHQLPYVGYGFDSIPGSSNSLAKVDLNNHSHLVIDGTGSHIHSLSIDGNGSHAHTVSVSNTGSGNSQNLQPFMSVYIWVRVA